MLKKATLKNAINRILEMARPSKIILFGSYAKKTADDNSDLDLLIIEPDIKNKGLEMVRLRNIIGDIGIGVDILVYSEDEIREWGNVLGSTLYTALKEGKVLYARTIS